jgi:uncharacterized protein
VNGSAQEIIDRSWFPADPYKPPPASGSRARSIGYAKLGIMTSPLPVITVRGTASREVPPDSFTVRISLTDRADVAADAAAALGLRWQRVEEFVGRLPAAVTVERGPVFRHQERFTPQGPATWVAGRTLTLRGADPDGAEDVLAAISPLEDQIGGMDVEGPHWQLVDDKAAREQLEAEAVAEALSRARRYAAVLGGTLGGLVELADPGLLGDASVGLARAAAGAQLSFGGMNFAPVPVQVSAAVDARWQLVVA